MLNILQKKGDPQFLTGNMFVYARILPGPMPEGPFPWAEMVHSGLLVVNGDFRDTTSFTEFLRKKGVEQDSDLSHLAEKLRDMGEDIPDDVSPEELRERIEEMSHLEIVPVPARVVGFPSEEALLKTEADIFFMGEFQGLQHAHLAVTSFPILYQALYREQESRKNRQDIDDLLEQVMTNQPDFGDPVVLDIEGNIHDYAGDLRSLLLGKVLPNLVYNLGNSAELNLSLQNFRRFMEGYRWPSDFDAFAKALEALRQGDTQQNRHLELLCEKICALQQEQFEKLREINAELQVFQSL